MVDRSLLTLGVGQVPPGPVGWGAKMAPLFYAGPSPGTLSRGNATQKILEMILIEHLGSEESRRGNEIGPLEKKVLPRDF